MITNIIRGQRENMYPIDEACFLDTETIIKMLKPLTKTAIATGCPYCEDWTTKELPIKSNADLSRTTALIAQGDKKKEIVFHNKGVAYGIEINFCPICGRKLAEKEGVAKC